MFHRSACREPLVFFHLQQQRTNSFWRLTNRWYLDALRRDLTRQLHRIIRPQIGRSTQLTGDALDKKAREYLIPGVILMPSGVFALVAAQQARCGMCAALIPSATGAS